MGNSKRHGVGIFHFHVGVGGWYTGEFQNGSSFNVWLNKAKTGELYLQLENDGKIKKREKIVGFNLAEILE